jgi:hypothetical protein
MCSRFAFAVLFCAAWAAASPAQEITGDVVVQGASMNDGYQGWTTCGVDGQVYRRPGMGAAHTVMRVSPNGSSQVFILPDHAYPGLVAPFGTGVRILSAVYVVAERRVHFRMYHFDSQASLLEQNQGTLPLYPQAMAVLPLGRTIAVGSRVDDPDHPEDRKYGFAILDENDQLVRSVDLPLPPGGGGWTFASGEHIAVGDGVAYVMLHSNEPPQTAIATISEAGHIDITIVAVPPDSDKHHHNEWLFGPGVAVEVYHYLVQVSQRPRAFGGFDEYDLKTGKKVATKGSFPVGFAFGCYSGNEVSMLAHSAHVDPARRLSPETLRLVTVKLQQAMPQPLP